MHLTIRRVNQAIDHYHFHLTTDILREFIWNQFCDWYLEMIKHHHHLSWQASIWVLGTVVKLMHPFMPYITEDIWQTMGQSDGISHLDHASVMMSSWPSAAPQYIDDHLNRDVGLMTQIIRTIRHLRKNLIDLAISTIAIDCYTTSSTRYDCIM